MPVTSAVAVGGKNVKNTQVMWLDEETVLLSVIRWPSSIGSLLELSILQALCWHHLLNQ